MRNREQKKWEDVNPNSYLAARCPSPSLPEYNSELVSQLTEQNFVPSQIKGYRWSLQKSNYAGIEQRWLVVESQARRKSDLKRTDNPTLRWVFQ